MAVGHHHARRRRIGRRWRRVPQVHWRAARRIGLVLDWADEEKQRLSWVPPWLSERGIGSRPEQLATWLGPPWERGFPASKAQRQCQLHGPMRARRPRS